MLEAARQGFLTMPYSNPTWWDLASPTLAALNRAELLGATALNASGAPIFETYQDSPPRSGVVMSPSSPFVVARIARAVRDFSWNASGSPPPPAPCEEASAALPSTFVFEDQIGARFPPNDFAPSERGRGAAGYAAGLLAHAAAHAEVGLHTEQGFDRLARSMLAFHGSALQYLDGGGDAGAPFGLLDVAWRPEPLFAASGLRALATPHQHDLDPAAMAANVPRLCWSLAMGVHLSLDVGNAAALANVRWTRTVAAVQRLVAARFEDFALVAWDAGGGGSGGSAASSGGRRVSSFAADALTPPLDPLYSAAYSVVWHSNASAPPASVALPGAPGPSTLAAGGCAAFGAAGDASAGIYAGVYNGAALAGPGSAPHVVAVDAACDLLATPPALPATLCVEHPLGADTALTLALPAVLRRLPAARLRVAALGAGNAPIPDVVPFVLSADGAAVTFSATAVVGGVEARVFVVTLAAL